MARGLPPNPSQYRDPRQWMEQMYAYLTSETRVTQDNDPLPILLPHRMGGLNERAGQAGVVLYDAARNVIVTSDGTQWVPNSAVPSFTAAEIADLTSSVNTVYKVSGAVVYDSTNATLAVANGSGASDTWSRLTVAATVTPV